MFLAGLGTAVPRNRYTQAECWMAVQRAPQFRGLSARAQQVLRRVLGNEGNGIRTRHLAVDALDEVFDAHADTLHARFARHAPELASDAARLALAQARLPAKAIDAVLVSTCTGYLCPGLTSYLSERLELRPDTVALDLVGQGCAAALPNLRTAQSLLADGRCRFVLSVCVEVCSAAFYIDDDIGVLISACLFGDGAGAAVLSAEEQDGPRRVQWKGAWSLTQPGHRDALRFEHRAGMLRNVLTPEVPALAASHAGALLRKALDERRLASEEVQAWILHAGGRDVLENIRRATGLTAAQTACSASVLNDFGNLSSAFVYFVLERALRQGAPDGWWWMSSFGAGFSCHGALIAVSSRGGRCGFAA